MNLRFLDFICCPECQGDLSCHNLPADKMSEIENGVLLCTECQRWYPIISFIPELLPDQIRDWDKDLMFLKKFESSFSPEILTTIKKSSSRPLHPIEDKGYRYKQAEIHIKEKVTDPDFFGPGFSAPFNPGDTGFTIQLINRFGNALPLFELKPGDVILDICAGYAWTTEWLKKMGAESIALDICRTYLDIGIKRMGKNRPHLLVGDIENLPLKDHVLNGVLSFDAFHHIYNRKKAMAHFFRVLKEDGRMVLAEPGGKHECAEGPRAVMEKYGILEKGMELEDIRDYCEGLEFLPPEQHFVLKIHQDEKKQKLKPEFIQNHSYVDCNFFLIKKANKIKPD